ncbi:related to YND1 - apyrase (NDPase/NTPase) [Melanopsichium pennsylvanicum]|uniref:Related to YND1 - apyrase (NDPase/NTPase) n=2 Tax=Melanopsichium pennsylvanicum TaxID=63383 RepID=A0AAJ5C397_9BASI|nr:related to YND1-apyrase (NDPase/NTPase) [Melanopsichium pennsylvanicum 4]SNX82367.1 related to YND1 - apyrase (NDPase/NTPase) [Melanopsichium pennsylvanicum]
MSYPIQGSSSQPYAAYTFNTPVKQRQRRQLATSSQEKQQQPRRTQPSYVQPRENVADAFTWNAAKASKSKLKESPLKHAAPGAAQVDAPASWLEGRKYAVLVDAGSSGSRMQVYSWKDPKLERALRASKGLDAKVLPKVEKGTWENSGMDWSLKIEPGLSSYGDHPADVGSHLKVLLDHAEKIVPPSALAETPIYVMATAGMRLLPDHQREAVLSETCRYIRQHTSFSIDGGGCSEHVQVISGEEEGLLGWISINYLMDGFHIRGKKASLDGETDIMEGKSTFGFLDMGGASTQIAFEPSKQALQGEGAAAEAELTTVPLRMLDGTEVSHEVFVTTFLGYGTNQARNRYIDLLGSEDKAQASKHALTDPCLPNGLQLSEIDGKPDVSLTGTGNFTACLESIHPLLDKEAMCNKPPCLFHGVHVPKIDFSVNHFIGVSEYWFSSQDIFGLGGVYDFVDFQKAAVDFCGKPWAELKQHLDAGDLFGPAVQLNRLQTQCFKAAWMVTVLHEGIGIPRIVDHKGAGDGTDHADEAQGKGEQKNLFQSVNDIDGFSVSWTLGKAVLEASRDIPPAPGSLPSPFDELNKSNSKLGKWDPFRPKWPTTGEGSAFPPALGGASRHVSPVSLIIMVAIFLSLLVTCICTRGRGPRATRRRAVIKEMLPPPIGTFGGLCSPKRIGRGDYVLANMEEATGDVLKRGFWSKLGKRAEGNDYSPTMEAEFGFNSEGSSEESSATSASAGRGSPGGSRKRSNTGIAGVVGWPVRRVTLALTSTFPSLAPRRATRAKKRNSSLPISRVDPDGTLAHGRIAARRGSATPTMVRVSRPASPTFTGITSGTAISRPASRTSSRAPTPVLGHRLTSASLTTRSGLTTPGGTIMVSSSAPGGVVSPTGGGSPLGERHNRPNLFAASLSRAHSITDLTTIESGLLGAHTATTRTPSRQGSPAPHLSPMTELRNDDSSPVV